MPRIPGCEAVYEVANQWRDRCLKSDGSLLWPNLVETTWAPDNLQSARGIINELVVKNTNTGGHMEQRLHGEPDEIKRVIADATAIWNICPGSIGIEGRKGFVGFVAGWSDSPPHLDAVNEAIQANVGGKESSWFKPGFQIQRGAHLRFILELGRRLKVEGIDPASYLEMRLLMQSIGREYPRSASAKNMVLYMLFPDETEPIFNNWARDRIAEAPVFAEFFNESSDFDDAITSIRKWYSAQLGRGDFDFYDPEIRNVWRPSDDHPGAESNATSEYEPMDEPDEGTQFWWVNQGRSFEEECRGEFIYAPGRSQSGAPLQHHQLLNDMRRSDWIVHYSQGAIRAIGQVTSGVDPASQDGLRAEVHYQRLDHPISLGEFPRGLIIRGEGPFDRNGSVKQQYAFPLSPDFASSFAQHFRDTLPAGVFGFTAPTPPSLSELSSYSNLELERLQDIESLLLAKKQIIFEGPPGSGKTYLARLFARYLAGVSLDKTIDEHVEIVQFHQSYGYEDFVAGIRPVTSDLGTLTYQNQPGLFVEMCRRAAELPNETFVLIIDEINRGNLSRIFGELLYGLEYRGQPVRMQYPDLLGDDSSDHLTIPENLYIIGTMNSTDRSLAMIDYALRRRFYFWRLMPTEAGAAPVLGRWLEAQTGVSPAERARLHDAFVTLNAAIAQALGDDYQIGHSYLMLDNGEIGDQAALERVWRHAIDPLLREYFHTRPNAGAMIEQLRAGFFKEPVTIGEIEEAVDLQP